MRSTWAALLLLNMVSADPIVFNEGVTYKGTSGNGVDQFQGIAFAQDTSGANRFAPPKPYFPPKGSIVDATKPGPSCPQAIPGLIPPSSNTDYQSEDCLNLRIAKPAFPCKDLPVMVYIYGGGAIMGTAYDAFFNPAGLVQQSVQNGQPVVYVAMNYRLGIFGFAAAGILKRQKAENNGLRDQHLALKWIKDNIRAFGGDPKRVTLFGQSFGGISVGLQLVAWGGKQEALFQKAIMTSGAISKDRNDAVAKANTAAVADGLNCTTKNGVVDSKVLTCLRKLPLSDLLKVNLDVATKSKPVYGFAAFSAVVDGDFIPDQPKTLLRRGHFLRDIPLIATWTSDDGSLSVDTKTKSDSEVVNSFASGIVDFSQDVGSKILSLYPVSDFKNQASSYQGVSPQYFRASRIVRDLDPVCPLLTLVQQVSKYSTKDLYVGELNETRLLPYWQAWGSPLGVSHLSDIPYIFNEALPPPGDNSPGSLALSANYSGSFISFANRGNPVTEGKKTFQQWPKANTDGSFGLAALVIGGLHGTGPAATSLQHSADAKQKVFSGEGLHDTGPEELRKRTFRYGPPSARAAALAQEKLVERCRYLSRLQII